MTEEESCIRMPHRQVVLNTGTYRLENEFFLRLLGSFNLSSVVEFACAMKMYLYFLRVVQVAKAVKSILNGNGSIPNCLQQKRMQRRRS